MPNRLAKALSMLLFKLSEYIQNSSLLKFCPKKAVFSIYSFLNNLPRFYCCLKPTGVISPHFDLQSLASQRSLRWYLAPGARIATTWQSLEWIWVAKSRQMINNPFISFIERQKIYSQSNSCNPFLYLIRIIQSSSSTHKQQQMQVPKLQLLHYKNAIFHGYLSNLRKQGQAIALFDNRAILIGKFHNDQLTDQCAIMLTPDTYFMGNFRKGLLDGSFSIRTPRFSIYSQTRMNKVEGEILVIDRVEKRGRVWEIQNGEGNCIREGEYDHMFSQEKIAKAIAPYTKLFPTLLEHFLLNGSNKFSAKTGKGKDRLDLSMQVRAMRRLTIQFQRQRVIAAGIMSQGFIFGLGYIYDKSQNLEIQGEIDRNQLHGEGIKHEISTNRSKYGKFARGDIRTLDILTDNNQSADASLMKLKKKVHVHSLQYTNDYLNERPIYLLRNFLEDVVQNEFRYSQFRKQQGTQLQEQLNLAFSREISSDQLSRDIKEYNLINSALKHKK